MLPSAAELVARFLRAGGYTETLKSFVQEAELPADIGATSESLVTIESILEEKKRFDLSLSFEKLGVNDTDQAWAIHAPVDPRVVSSLPSRSNILSISVLHLQLPSATETKQYVGVTTADRQLHLVDPTTHSLDVVKSFSSFQDSPTLDLIAVGSKYLLIASMSGKLTLFNIADNKILEERKDHSKYLVKLSTWSINGSSILVASAGWDAKIILYQIDVSAEKPQLGDPIATLALPSIPESTLFVTLPGDGTPALVVARRDSTFLHYYAVPSPESPAFTLIGKQNLAPHSNAWIAFTPSDIQICPTNPHLAAIATSSTPHMKLLIVKLLLPPTRSSMAVSEASLGTDGPVTQASQARAELATADKEESAILVNVSTLAPQTAYSTPRLVWRPDGTGVYVSSDDGVVRGLEARSGKLVSSLHAHEPGSKLRCLWAGYMAGALNQDSGNQSKTEYLISGGFDQKLIIWSPS
ncbi:WD40-repeat-containing domain [Pyrenophora seminiperda CCB06]|uniref:WD40-repeat-containing domain n=1 Tax=Pyrenophora seminiperda CCB06 TaxID=1302712 RepID=A0A3M7MCM0_9PLEO|nr:WD40-repeat-containing domain [Pyrenophora seminiperda CCB06]